MTSGTPDMIAEAQKMLRQTGLLGRILIRGLARAITDLIPPVCTEDRQNPWNAYAAANGDDASWEVEAAPLLFDQERLTNRLHTEIT